MRPHQKLTGYILAALAAAAYGTNPAFAIPLYEQGLNPTSVLLFRYVLSLPMLAAMIAVRGMGFRLKRNEIGPVAILGMLMSLSSLGLFASYEYLNSGIASTLLFIYPVLVAIMMIFIYHEKFKPSLAVCLALMIAGLLMLMDAGPGARISTYGVLLVILSSVTYAIYIVMVNVSPTIRGIPTTRLLFYLIAWGSLLFIGSIAVGTPLTLPKQPSNWINLICLAALPTVLSLWCTTRAIQLIGSTPTAIFGALEPVTAVLLSVLVLDQTITGRDILGATLIVAATTIVISARPVDALLLHVRKLFPRRRKSHPDNV
ncbi:MAG: DMT family transporter [Muribaculaceae bacterium]|nr:DMT family transporter [Muribaculaceae bacterium]